MKNARFKYEYRNNASKLHKAVGETLRNSFLFKNHLIYQEYPVDKVNSNCRNGRLKFDWVIPSLQLVIEAHGIQHYIASDFSGKLTQEEKEQEFLFLQERDNLKKQLAIEAGYSYIVIPYSMEESKIIPHIVNTIKNTPTMKVEQQKPKKNYSWKEQYQKAKQWRKEHGFK